MLLLCPNFALLSLLIRRIVYLYCIKLLSPPNPLDNVAVFCLVVTDIP